MVNYNIYCFKQYLNMKAAQDLVIAHLKKFNPKRCFCVYHLSLD